MSAIHSAAESLDMDSPASCPPRDRDLGGETTKGCIDGCIGRNASVHLKVDGNMNLDEHAKIC